MRHHLRRPRMLPPPRNRQPGLRTANERGSEAIEAAIGVPAFLLLISMIIAAGRIAMAHQAVESAASEAARSASITRTQQQAGSVGTAAATATLANQGLDCTSHQVSLDTTGFASPVGTPAKIAATVTCVVRLDDVGLPGLPGRLTITKTMTSPIDTYRER
jgi:Flp pilus assembly protein TadG